VVQQDEKEKNRRAILNFGHTLGHVLETLGHYTTFLHGEAVAIGMIFAAELSKRLGTLSDDACSRLRLLLQRLGLPVAMPDFPVGACLATMRFDKKIQQGKIRFVLLDGIGKAYMAPIDEAVLEKTLSDVSAIRRP
jgi:3-dehydroquinate synthase